MGGMQTLLHKARMLSGQGPEQVRRERARAPAVRAVLLYGAPRTGKSALVRASDLVQAGPHREPRGA